MMKEFEGSQSGDSLRFAVLASRFNDEIVSALIDGATNCLQRHGVPDDAIELYRVPGAYELPVLAASLAGRFDAMIALGALIRGETPHFDYISSQVSLGLSEIAVRTGTPIAFGVLTCDTIEQARHRSSSGSNKGWEAALAAIEMGNLLVTIRHETGEPAGRRDGNTT